MTDLDKAARRIRAMQSSGLAGIDVRYIQDGDHFSVEMKPRGKQMSVEERAEKWHNEKYGKDVDVYATYRKLVEEVGELGEAIMKADLEHSANFGNVREELGDVGLVLTHLIRRFVPWNISVADVFHEALDKVEERDKRPEPELRPWA